MKVNTRVAGLLVQAMTQSLTVDMMTVVARRVIPNYDVYERSGFPPASPCLVAMLPCTS